MLRFDQHIFEEAGLPRVMPNEVFEKIKAVDCYINQAEFDWYCPERGGGRYPPSAPEFFGRLAYRLFEVLRANPDSLDDTMDDIMKHFQTPFDLPFFRQITDDKQQR